MKLKRFLCILLILSLLAGFAGCGARKPTPVSPATTAAPVTQQPDYTTVPTETAPADADPVLPPLEFDEEKATFLGDFDTEIYGKLRVYFQDERLVIFDSYGTQRFELYANSYQPLYNGTPVELIGDDVNFDGYTDFYLLYSQANLNAYYFFWLWNMQKRTYEYYLPLSSVPSPEIDDATHHIISSDQIDLHTVITTEYMWQNGNILPIGHGEHSILPDESTTENIIGPEDVDISLSISDGHILSSVTLQMNEHTNADWLCRIEDERIVRIYSESRSEEAHTHRFLFRGLAQGTTTVVLRYANNWNAPYVAQRILNITVRRDGTLKILLVE